MEYSLTHIRSEIDQNLGILLQEWADFMSVQEAFETPVDVPPFWEVAKDLSEASNAIRNAEICMINNPLFSDIDRALGEVAAMERAEKAVSRASKSARKSSK